MEGNQSHVSHFSESIAPPTANPSLKASQRGQFILNYEVNKTNLVNPPAAHLHPSKMRTYDDTFSGEKIYPGKGKLYVRGDGKVFRFQNGKTESLFLQRKNPRRISWTTLYRRQHKKGISEEVAKKRTRRAVKSQRAVVGASLDVIKERRSMRPEARLAARQQAIKEGKERKSAAESKKRAEKAKSATSAARGQANRIQSKQGAKGAPPKVAAKTR
ncbi:60S ribosomal protein L24 [Emergomyces africanus]|uniref:60S ribosomal protein L24 n=1 Tax=Emergomyces africanus TaxID=1955775 RepID=A0A1B7P6X8_9EURO|nr:60S ribosomal protein L24 [Emergomyces africanus]